MDNEDKSGWGVVALFAVLHLLCCGIPLLLLSGVSLAFLAPKWPYIGAGLAVLGVVGFIWYLKRGCATCRPPVLEKQRRNGP
jgi:glucose dehydrogenase